MSATLKLKKQRGCGTPLNYLPTINVTSIWHLVGGETGPGWQEMKVELHHNEFVALGQLSLCVQKWSHNENRFRLHIFQSVFKKPATRRNRSLLERWGSLTPPQQDPGTSSCLSECFRGISPPFIGDPCVQMAPGLSSQHTYWPFRGSGSASSTGRSTNWPSQRPARRQGPK